MSQRRYGNHETLSSALAWPDPGGRLGGDAPSPKGGERET